MENKKLVEYLTQQNIAKSRKVKPRYFELSTKAIERSNTEQDVKQLVEAEKCFKKALKVLSNSLPDFIRLHQSATVVATIEIEYEKSLRTHS